MSILRAARARARCRVDLAGGTLDIWPLGVMHTDASTVNVTIDVGVSATVRPRPEGGYRVVQGGDGVTTESLAALATNEDTRLVAAVAGALQLPPAEVELASASPRGAGLGASSALAIALMAAIDHGLGRPAPSVEHRANVVRDLEAGMMQRPTGVQDQYPPQMGGVLALRYQTGATKVERLDVDLAGLGASLVVAYSGRSHISGDTNWQIVRGRLDGDPALRATMTAIAEVAGRMAAPLVAGDFAAVGRLLDEEWHHRRQLAEGVSTPEVERLLSAARDGGAWGGKVCGAGGGGCVAVLAPPDLRATVAEALSDAGGTVLDASPHPGGVEVELA